MLCSHRCSSATDLLAGAELALEMGSPLASLILLAGSATLPVPQGSEVRPLLPPQMELALVCQWRRKLGPLSAREASDPPLLPSSPSPPLDLEPLRPSLAASGS